MTIEEVITVLAMQEEILQFGHFTNEDAWALGNIIVAEARKRGLDTAVEIRLNNGYTVFKYAGNSTNLNNESWMTKMYNTVRRMEKSTMLLYSEMKKSEETLEDIGLNTREYSCMGGGFPIRIEEVGSSPAAIYRVSSALALFLSVAGSWRTVIECISTTL